MTTFRRGDLVTINLVVESHFNECDVRLRQPDGYSDIFAKVSSLTMAKPKFDVDDRVTWSTPDGAKCFEGDVLSIADDHLWVSLGGGEFATVWTGKAMRVDPEPEPAVAACTYR